MLLLVPMPALSLRSLIIIRVCDRAISDVWHWRFQWQLDAHMPQTPEMHIIDHRDCHASPFDFAGRRICITSKRSLLD